MTPVLLAAHDAYVAAITGNDVDAFPADPADDVVLQAPGAPAIDRWRSDTP